MDEIVKLRNSFVRKKLRKASLQWPLRNEAVKKARKQRGKYECAGCGCLFDRKKLHLDHIDPVVSLKGEAKQESGEYDWNQYVSRLLCKTDNFQLLCELCHEIKTVVEHGIRVRSKRKRTGK